MQFEMDTKDILNRKNVKKIEKLGRIAEKRKDKMEEFLHH